MKINSLLESQTVSSAISNTTTSAPVFGRDEDKLEETMTSGCVSSVANPVGKVRSRGSIFSGINTSEKFPNSKAVKEENLPVFDKKQKYIQAAKDVLKGADFDHVARVRNLDVEMLRKFVGFAHEKLSKGEYKLNRPNLEEQGMAEGNETTPFGSVNDQRPQMPTAPQQDREAQDQARERQARINDFREKKQDLLQQFAQLGTLRTEMIHGLDNNVFLNKDQLIDFFKQQIDDPSLTALEYAYENDIPTDGLIKNILRRATQLGISMLDVRKMFSQAKQKLGENIGRKVDAKGLTQSEWMQRVKQRFPDAKIIQSKMIDGPAHALLSDGRKIVWNPAQDVAEGYDTAEDYRAKAQWLMRTHHLRPDEAMEYAYYDTDPATWKGSPWENDYKQGVAEGSLNEFAPAGGGGNIPRGPKTPKRGSWDDNGEDPYQLRRYNRSIDFFDQFDSDGVDKQNFDKATGEYEGYYFDRDAASGITQIAYFKFDDPKKIGDNDPGVGWYYEPIDEGVAEAGANTKSFRAGYGKRKETKPLSPEEQIAKDKAKADKWLEKQRAKMAAKKGVAEDASGVQSNIANPSDPKFNHLLYMIRNDYPVPSGRLFNKVMMNGRWLEPEEIKELVRKGQLWKNLGYGQEGYNARGMGPGEELYEQGVEEGYEDEDCHVCGGTGEGRTEYDTCYNCKGSGVEPHGHDDDDFDIPDDDYDDFGDDESYYEKSIRTRNLDEAEISEEMLAHELYKDLQIFKQGKDKTIGKKSKSKDISKKPEDRDIVVKEGTDMKASEILNEGKPGLWANIHAKRERIKHGSGERMRKPGSKGAPSAQDFKDAAKTEAANPAQQAAIAIAMKKKGQKPKNENAEYDDEAGMADNNLETMRRAVEGIDELISSGDNLPEWCQEKIAISKSMLVAVWDYMKSEEDRALAEEFDMIESIVEGIAVRNNVNSEAIWEDLESLTDDELYVFAVTSEPINEDWQKVNKKDKTDGMSPKAVKAYRRENPGSKLKTAVTTKPSKLKKGSKASKRRKSYCSRSKGQMNMHNISCSKTPDKAICKARRRWNC